MAKGRVINLFHGALDYALEKSGNPGIVLKEAQYEAIKSVVVEKKDTICILPTGYGKSLIYQLLPNVFDFFLTNGEPGDSVSSIIVISPLNALMQDQISKLKGHLNVRIVKGSRYNVSENSGDEGSTIEQLKEPPQILFAHPEVLIENRKIFHEVLRSKIYKERVKAIVVDEAHLVVEWKEFRPCYGKLGLLTSVFHNIPSLALTATATQQTKKEIVKSLGLLDPLPIEINPDRANIFLASYPRPNQGDTKLENILRPLADELINMRQDFPLTLIYGNLATIAECFLYFSNRTGHLQYEPLGAAPLSKNRMFSQFHAQYPDHERERIVQELVDGKSKLRILFVTVAFGIGVDVRNIRRIIHIGVPHTLEEYFQEAGRCGRDGLPGSATIYYNSYDISAAKKNMSQSMRDYVKFDKCKREMILSYFGYKPPTRAGPQHTCCDFHQKHCKCEDCILVSASQMLELHENTQLQSTSVADEDNTTTSEFLDTEQKAELREELINFRQSLHGSGKTCVGRIDLASGFSMALIDMVVSKAKELTSVEKIKSQLPIFDEHHALKIFNIVQKYSNP